MICGDLHYQYYVAVNATLSILDKSFLGPDLSGCHEVRWHSSNEVGLLAELNLHAKILFIHVVSTWHVSDVND